MKAVIDIGSNSVRALWQEASGQAEKQALLSTRLADDLDSTGAIGPAAIRRCQEGLVALCKCMPEEAFARSRVVATSALREATNGSEVREVLAYSLGRPISLLSPSQEAFYAFLGASRSFSGQKLAVLDIGGGSTELSWKDYESLCYRSIPLGALRLLHQQLDAASLAVRLQALSEGLPKDLCGLIGIGGSINSLAAIDLGMLSFDASRIHGHLLSKDRIVGIRKQIAAKRLQERYQIVGLPPDRADIILPGIDILLGVLSALSLDWLRVSCEDLLHGLLHRPASDPIGWEAN